MNCERHFSVFFKRIGFGWEQRGGRHEFQCQDGGEDVRFRRTGGLQGVELCGDSMRPPLFTPWRRRPLLPTPGMRGAPLLPSPINRGLLTFDGGEEGWRVLRGVEGGD
jgi:hypothetical protein